MHNKQKKNCGHKLLIIAPNLNHYKVRQLNMLSPEIGGLKVLYSLSHKSTGHIPTNDDQIHFDRAQIKNSKNRFIVYLRVKRTILQEIKRNNFKIVLFPMENKHLTIILFIYILKFIFKFKLASYNHHFINRRTNKLLYLVDKSTTRTLTRLFDIIIYYTETGMQRSIEEKMVNPKKAFFANNTLDVENIFSIVDENTNKPQSNILFIGRINQSKRIDILIDYFKEIKKNLQNCQLFIIGCGPEFKKYKQLSKEIKDIHWLGGIIDEKTISKYMQISKIVFVPGHSGLSINHSFAYRKPYITLERKSHPPEIEYIQNGKNGLILPANDKENNIKKITKLLMDDTYYNQMSQAAYETAKKLTLENWVLNMKKALQL